MQCIENKKNIKTFLNLAFTYKNVCASFRYNFIFLTLYLQHSRVMLPKISFGNLLLCYKLSILYRYIASKFVMLCDKSKA